MAPDQGTQPSLKQPRAGTPGGIPAREGGGAYRLLFFVTFTVTVLLALPYVDDFPA